MPLTRRELRGSGLLVQRILAALIDIPDLLVIAAYERVASALAGAVEEMREAGRPLPEGAHAILLKHLLAHFDGLEAQCRDLLDPGLEQQLLQAAVHERTQ